MADVTPDGECSSTEPASAEPAAASIAVSVAAEPTTAAGEPSTSEASTKTLISLLLNLRLSMIGQVDLERSLYRQGVCRLYLLWERTCWMIELTLNTDTMTSCFV